MPKGNFIEFPSIIRQYSLTDYVIFILKMI